MFDVMCINIIYKRLSFMYGIYLRVYNSTNAPMIPVIPKILSASRKHAYIILTPLNPLFYIVKLGFTGVYIIFIIFLILLKNIDCGYSFMKYLHFNFRLL